MQVSARPGGQSIKTASAIRMTKDRREVDGPNCRHFDLRIFLLCIKRPNSEMRSAAGLVEEKHRREREDCGPKSPEASVA